MKISGIDPGIRRGLNVARLKLAVLEPPLAISPEETKIVSFLTLNAAIAQT